ncbi:AraC family transcriptional regulator [Brevibacillus reuszeri]|uniref:AraC family transcriptional regulator n=1 Tax=Brevibacillus reuszeri TaxID=54915 RepID=A0A0K9YKZ2_9BACL|nr:AraC family transcriptional regulator [Brevibacillus reuszeri]KNB69349.1 AraC family transcriptional regulator [Brevibacillus reuszeri]MED1860351.1 AraC family transcriptional regulator [Brevibacillus reuszeri]GED70763.1 AraC family transcriptional regulator [Brevibacillus reuszeri]
MLPSNVHSIYDSYFDALPFSPEVRDKNLCDTERKGHIKRIVPRPGLELVDSCYLLHESCKVGVQSSAAMVELSFCLQGSGEVSVAGSEQVSFMPDSCSLHLMRDFRVEFSFQADVPFHSISVGISVEQFDAWLSELDEGPAYSFEGLLGSKAFRRFQMPILPEMARLLPNLNGPSFSQPRLRKLQVEGKVLELASLGLDTFLFGHELHRSKSTMSRHDREKIRQARDILLARMESPPSLIELAKMAQINEFKLKVGFKEEYGTSVFAYLREKRLEKAWSLLRDGNHNVSQTASAVGFSNFSHFAEAFRKQYGLNPSDMKRGR